jgi:peptidoglycan/xylan/chitin deacetylase (PgdA/CDA1 family)
MPQIPVHWCPVLRTRAKHELCRGLTALGLDQWLGRMAHTVHRPWVVGYHQVVEDLAGAGEAMPGLPISVGTLERHLKWIAQRFEIVSLDELGKVLESGQHRPRPLAAITFDDGYRGVHDLAFPLLKRLGIPAAVFAVTDLIGSSDLLLHDRLYWLLKRKLGSVEGAYRATRAILATPEPGRQARVIEMLSEEELSDRGGPQPFLPLTWEMLAEMQAGGIVIGSHTRTHPVLVGLEPQALASETLGSRQILERRLRRSIDHFAYPDGQFDPSVVEAVAKSGYRFAYTACAHRDPLSPSLTLPRTMLWENSTIDGEGEFSPAIMGCQANGIFEVLGGCDAEHAGV